MQDLGKVFRTVFTGLFQPAFLIVVFVLWWVMPTRPDAPLETAAVLLLFANLVVYAIEHVVPDRPDWRTVGNDRKVDSFFVVVRVFVFGPLLQIMMVLGLEPLVDAVGLPSIWPTSWHVAARIALALVVAEFTAFVIHALMHRVGFLWRYHATHHAQEKLSSARWAANHPVEIALVQLPIFILVTVLGPEMVDVAGAIVIGRTTVVVAHANLHLSSNPIGWILTTPDLHRRHHMLKPDHQANYGDVLIIFDRLFRTFCDKQATEVGVGAGQRVALRDQYRLRGINLSELNQSASPVFEPRETVIDLREPERVSPRS